MIELSHTVDTSSFGSVRCFVSQFPSGQSYWSLTGTVDLSGKLSPSGSGWRREAVFLTLPIPGIGMHYVRLQRWEPCVTLRAPRHGAQAANVDWHLDSSRLVETARKHVPVRAGALIRTATICCDISARGIDDRKLRLGYAVHLMGRVELAPLSAALALHTTAFHLK